MCNACDLARLVACSAFVCAIVFREGASDGELVDTIFRVHLEVLGGFDHLVVVIPSDDRICEGVDCKSVHSRDRTAHAQAFEKST